MDCGCSNKILSKHNQSKLMRNVSKKQAKLLHTYTKQYCKECNKITLHNYYNSCSICMHKDQDYSNLAFHFEYCEKCSKDTLHNGSICCICHPKSGNIFNREEFYKEKFDIISFDSLEQEATLESFDSLKGKLGVWARWTDKNHGNYCLDVCKTIDIGGEMLSSLRSFNSLAENPKQELDTGWEKKYYKQAEDAGLFDIINPGKIIFKIVALCDSEDEALKIEAQYSHDNKVKYWSPEPGQKLYY